MKKYENPMVYISIFDTENIVTTSGNEPQTYAANTLNVAMYGDGANGTTTTQIGNLFALD